MQNYQYGWPYFPYPAYNFPYFCSPQSFHVQLPAQNIPTPSQIPKENQQQISQKSKQQGVQPLISLTVEDLIAGGYQTDKKPWGEDQDLVLKKMAKKQKMDWEEVAKHLPGRNPKMCYNRYRRLEYSTKKYWTSKENSTIMESIKQFGKNWHQIANKLQGRTVKQIKDHYTHYLDPQLNLSPWCLEEDIKLINLIKQYGLDWKIISQNFTQRTQFQIKNRYFGKLKKMDQRKRSKQEKNSNVERQQD